MELKQVWMSQDTRKQSRYSLRTLGGILGIVILALALVLGGTALKEEHLIIVRYSHQMAFPSFRYDAHEAFLSSFQDELAILRIGKGYHSLRI